MEPLPDLLVTGDGKHLAIIDERGTPWLLRDRAGDFVRDLISENAGFDGDPPPWPLIHVHAAARMRASLT
jgi:competence protein ComEC